MRAFVIGDRVIAAIYRSSSTGSPTPPVAPVASAVRSTDDLATSRCAAADAVGGGILAVDLAESRRGLLVLEVNHTMEFRNSIATTGVDLARGARGRRRRALDRGRADAGRHGGSAAVRLSGVNAVASERLRRDRRRQRLRRRRVPAARARHPHLEVTQVTSERHAGWPVALVHPNLRGSDLRFVGRSTSRTPTCSWRLAARHAGRARRRGRALAPRLSTCRPTSGCATRQCTSAPTARRTRAPTCSAEFVYASPSSTGRAAPAARRHPSGGCGLHRHGATVLALLPLVRRR
jgi:hypothetical protein